MRISVDRGDLGFIAFASLRRVGSKITVLCNGRAVPLCFLADEEEGIARGFTPHPDTGRPFVVGDRIHESEYRGRVEIRVAA